MPHRRSVWGFVFASICLASPALAQTAPPAARPPILGRWLDLQSATLNLRYRHIDTTGGVTVTNQVQHRESLRARLKFDRPGRYTLNVGFFSGTRFTSGWDNTGWGINPSQKNVAFRAVFLGAVPIKGVEAQYGGLYIIRGESTEVTSYDEDGYIVGQRLRIRRPKQFYLDEISATIGYLTLDAREISIGKRTKYLNDTPNYRHFLIDKKLGALAGISTDFTYADGSHTWREAVSLKTPALRAVDALVFENYQRTAPNAEHGFALTLDKALSKRVSLNWGYASIDPQYGGFNSDRFHSGDRVFAMLTYGISPRLQASAFATRIVRHDVPLPQGSMLNLAFTYNALPDLRRTGLF